MITPCPIQDFLNVFGDKWSLLIMRDLIFKNHQHYHIFAKSLNGIASNILSDRLKKLEQEDFIEKHNDPLDHRRFIYRLSKKGKRLAPVLLEISELMLLSKANDAKVAQTQRDHYLGLLAQNKNFSQTTLKSFHKKKQKKPQETENLDLFSNDEPLQ